MTPLRRKMLEDMQLRDFAEKTREAYLAAVKALAGHYGRSPDLIAEEEVRAYFLHMVNVRKLELLGHKSPQTTAVYTHLTDRSLDRLGAALEEIAAGL